MKTSCSLVWLGAALVLALDGASFAGEERPNVEVKDFAIETVRMSIAGRTLEKAVTSEDTHARFTLELEAGDADLETWLIGDGKDGVAYFVTVQFNG